MTAKKFIHFVRKSRYRKFLNKYLDKMESESLASSSELAKGVKKLQQENINIRGEEEAWKIISSVYSSPEEFLELYKNSIDELPHLYNLLKGNMLYKKIVAKCNAYLARKWYKDLAKSYNEMKEGLE